MPNRLIPGLVLALALTSLAASPAQAVNVGYYDMGLGAGNASQVPPITAAGQTAVQLFDLQSSNLSGIDVLFVQNPANGSYGAEYLSRLSSVASAVSNGMILVLHDRYVTGAASVLPGGSTFGAQRDLTAPGANDINILDATSPVVSGPAGTLSATSLDGGSFSSHGYLRADTLPAGARLILWRPDPADAQSRNRIVTFAYAYGNGAVIYSTIPLDVFLAGSGPNPPRTNFTTIYAPNVVSYAALLRGGAPDLSVTISDGWSEAVPGRPVTYTVRAQNSGFGAAVGARVLTDLAAEIDGVTWSCAAAGGATCSTNGTGDVNDLVNLPVGGTVTYTVSGTIASGAFGTLQSAATVEAPSGMTDPVPGNNTAVDVDALTPIADLALTKVGPASATPGGTVAYTLTARNDGPSDAASVQLSDPTPSGLAFVSATSPCSGGFPCNLGTLAAGAQTSVTVTFSVPEPYFGPDPIVNVAAVRSATSDPVAANNTARSSTPAGGTASADLQLFLSAPPWAAKGSTVTFVARVVNQGTHDAAGVELLYTPPAGLLPPSPCCSLGSLAAGAETTVRLTFGIPAGYAGADPISFSASVSATTGDPAPGNNAASVSVPLGADTADLAVTKTGPAAVTLGSDLTYVLVVTNRGPAAAVNTQLSDPTPSGLTFISADAPCAGGFPCSLGTLASGASVTVRATFRVPSGYSGANPIQNTASVSSTTVEGFPADNEAIALTGVGGDVADLSVTASGPASAAAGTEVTWLVVVTNRGPGTARNVRLQETAPANLTFVRATSPCTGGLPCNLGDLPPGASVAVGVTRKIAANHVTPTVLVETVTIDSDSTDPAAGNNSSTVSTAVTYIADLGVTKTDGLTQVAAGMVLTYTIGVTNQGPSDVAGATVSDTFPAGLTGVTWACAASAGASCSTSGNGSINDTVNLAHGASLTYTAHATVAAGATGTISNSASVAVPASASDPVSGNNSATDADSVLLPANLKVQIIGGPATVAAGARLTYTLRVTNHGTGTATSVVLANPTPAGLTFVPAGSLCSGGFPCPLPDLLPEGLVEVSVELAVPPGYAGANPISTTASVSTATPGDDPADNTATLTTQVVFSSDLQITKTDGRSTLVPGEPVTYTIGVTNAGPSHAAGATVTDAPPSALLAPAWTCSGSGGASCPAASGTGGFSQTVTIPAGGSLTYLLTATLDPGAAAGVTNQATVAAAAGTGDPEPGNNLASDTDGLAPKADLSVSVTDGKTSAVPGEPVTYTVVVANAGPSAASGVTVTDTPPAALLSPAWTCSGTGGASCPAGSGTGGISQTVSLPAGGALTWQLTGMVDPAATGTLANTASAAVPPTITDPAAGNNSATDSEPLARMADLRIVPSGPGTVSRGNELALSFTVTNAGPSQAHVDLTAPTPAGLTWVSADAPCAGGFPCVLGEIAPGAEVQVTVRYLVPAGYAGSDPILHRAALRSDAADPTPADTTARSATAVGRAGQADLSLAKSAPSGSAVGSTVIYRLTVTNHGPDDALGISLTESIPAGLTFVSATAPCQAGFTCNLGYLAAGASRSVDVTLAIPAGYGGPSLIANNAAVSATTGDPVSGNNAASAVTTLIAAPIDLAVVQRAPSAVAAGQDVVYTLEVTNRGPASATNTHLADPTPTGLTFVAATAPCAGGFPCFLGTVAAGQTVTVQATFHVPAGYSGANPIVNTASATANENDGVADNDSATALTGVGAPAADLEVTQTGPAQAFAGGLASYNLLVRNLGPGTATAVLLQDPAPAGATFVSATGPCAAFPCTLGDLPAGSAVSILATFRLQPDLAQGTVVTNAASLTTTSIDPAAGNNATSATTTAQVQADLAITKTDGVTQTAPGRQVTYTVTVTNPGPSDAPGTRVIDSLPAALTGVSWTCSASPGSSCAAGASGTGSIDRVVNVAAGGTVTYTVSGTISPAATGTLSNTATVQPPAGIPDPADANNTATDTDALTPEADLSITKTDGSATAVPGRTVTYTITVSNLGPSDAPAVAVTDPFTADFSGITWTCTASAGSACTASGGGQILDTAQIRAGGSATYTATALLSPAATQPAVNTATVAALPGVTDPVAGNNSATDTDTLAPEADLAVVKDDGVTTAAPGGQVTYTITITNAGPSNAPGSTVSDVFPSAVTAVAWTCAASGGAQCGAASGTGNLQETFNLPAGATVTYQATATVSPAATGLLVNTASVATAAGITDPATGNNSEGDSDTLALQADLAITKTTALTAAVPGEPVTYTITVTNAGPSNAAGLQVSDVVPAALQNAAWTCVASAGSSCTAGGTGNIADTASLSSGGTLTYTLTATLVKTATGDLTNNASVSGPGGITDPQPANNSAAVTVPIASRPLDLYTIVPCRLIDTRGPNGPFGGPALDSGVPRSYQVTGTCGIPTTAKAVAVNVTVIQPTSSGFLRIYPQGDPVPNTSVLNFTAGKVLANNTILPLGPTGGIQALPTLFPAGSVHIVVDVMGYFD